MPPVTYRARPADTVDYQYVRDEVGIAAMSPDRTQRSVEPKSRVIAAALAIGVLYLTGLILIHQLAG